VGGWAIVADGSWMHGKRYPITEGIMTIGRSAEADITLPSTHLSRKHAKLQRTSDSVTIIDLGSMNGTYVNGKKVQEVAIRPGDQLRFDTFTFIVEGPSSAQDTMVRRAPKELTNPPPAAKPSPSAAKTTTTQRATSPGNRAEPPPKAATVSLGIMATALVIVCLGYLAYLLVFG